MCTGYIARKSNFSAPFTITGALHCLQDEVTIYHGSKLTESTCVPEPVPEISSSEGGAAGALQSLATQLQQTLRYGAWAKGFAEALHKRRGGHETAAAPQVRLAKLGILLP